MIFFCVPVANINTIHQSFFVLENCMNMCMVRSYLFHLLILLTIRKYFDQNHRIVQQFIAVFIHKQNMFANCDDVEILEKESITVTEKNFFNTIKSNSPKIQYKLQQQNNNSIENNDDSEYERKLEIQAKNHSNWFPIIGFLLIIFMAVSLFVFLEC